MMTHSVFEIDTKKLRETVVIDEQELVEINIRYPQLLADTKSAGKINRFYEGVAKEYYEYAVKRLAPVAKKRKAAGEESDKYGAVMQYQITFQNEKYLSVLLDISLYDGVVSNKTRRAQVWSLSDGLLLNTRDFLKNSRKTKTHIAQRIGEMAKGDAQDQPEMVRMTKKLFDYNRFYLTENGYAFYCDCPKRSVSAEPTVYVLPYHEFDDDHQLA